MHGRLGDAIHVHQLGVLIAMPLGVGKIMGVGATRETDPRKSYITMKGSPWRVLPKSKTCTTAA